RSADLGERASEELFVAHRRQPARAPPPPPGAEEIALPLEALLAWAEHGGREHDQADPVIPDLREREREVRGFTRLVAAVARQHVPDIVHVAEPVEEPCGLDAVSLTRIGLALHRRVDEPARAEIARDHERQVGATEAAFREARERGTI